MDGLSIRQGQSLLNTGRTASEIRSDGLSPQRATTPTVSPTGANSVGSAADSGSFQNVLRNAITETNSMQKEADVKVQALATGKTTNIPEVMMAVEKADIALRLMTQVRNKIIEAYQEVMKMQV